MTIVTRPPWGMPAAPMEAAVADMITPITVPMVSSSPLTFGKQNLQTLTFLHRGNEGLETFANGDSSMK